MQGDYSNCQAYSHKVKPLELLPEVHANEQGTLPTRELRSGSDFCGGRGGEQHLGKRNPPEDSLETQHYFQDSSDLNIENTKNYLEIISYDQARFDLIREHGGNTLN